MSYQVRYTDEATKGEITVEDSSINNTSTSLSFPGKHKVGYAGLVAENFLHLLENFALDTAPDYPTEGQLWYDTTDTKECLKIYNGTNWVPASGIFKDSTEPSSGAVAGDLWADTGTGQLYLYTGASSWTLIGPESSQGSTTGPRAVKIKGTDNKKNPVLIFYINNDVSNNQAPAIPAVIISINEFTPAENLSGFNIIKPGINLSSAGNQAGLLKYRGIAESAESLRINYTDVPATSFLRGDTDAITMGSFAIRNDQGLSVGSSGQLRVRTDALTSKIQENGVGLDIEVTQNGTLSPSISVRSNQTTARVGINNANPQHTLDVNGSLHVTGTITGDFVGNFPFAPVGHVVLYAGSDVPDGWMLCDGSEVEKTEKSILFGVIGVTHGTPADSSMFKLPNIPNTGGMKYIIWSGETQN